MMFKKTLASVLLAASLFGVTAPASAQMSCMSMDAARSILQQNPSLLSLNAAAAASGTRGQIVSAEFCNFNGQYVYVINELGGDGTVRRKVVSAQNGAVIPGA